MSIHNFRYFALLWFYRLILLRIDHAGDRSEGGIISQFAVFSVFHRETCQPQAPETTVSVGFIKHDFLRIAKGRIGKAAEPPGRGTVFAIKTDVDPQSNGRPPAIRGGGLKVPVSR